MTTLCRSRVLHHHLVAYFSDCASEHRHPFQFYFTHMSRLWCSPSAYSERVAAFARYHSKYEQVSCAETSARMRSASQVAASRSLMVVSRSRCSADWRLLFHCFWPSRTILQVFEQPPRISHAKDKLQLPRQSQDPIAKDNSGI